MIYRNLNTLTCQQCLSVALSILLLLPAIVVGEVAADIFDDVEFKHGIAFFHELKYPSDFTHLEYHNPDAPKGGALVQATSINFDTLAPAPENTSEIRPPGGSGDSLVIRSGDEVSAFYGRLADGIAVTDDQLAVIFRLHPQARWHDGVPITARDVAYTFNLRKSQPLGGMWFDFITEIEEVSDRYVVFHLRSPLTLNNIIMIQFNPILPEHYWRDKDPSASTLVPPLTSGPYKISSIQQGKFIRYTRVPDYWGKDIPVNKGRYNFDTMQYDIYRDATVTREAFRKGLIDIWTETDIRYWHSSYDTPALEKGWIKKIRRNFGMEVGVRSSIALNNRLPRFSDRRVRKALTLAMDFEWQNRTLHYGHHKRAHSYWPDTILTAAGLPSDAELALLEPFRDQLPQELFTRTFQFPEINSDEDRRATMVRARKLLADAGWVISAGALRNADGEAFEIEFLSRSSGDARTLLPYIQQLDQLGIQATIRNADTSQFINRLRKFKFDALLKTQDILMPPVIELRSTYHSDAANKADTRNTAGISHPAVDALIEQANLATTLEEMTAACRALDRVLLWQYYQIPLYAVDLRRTVHWTKFGRPAFEGTYWPAFPDGWWYDDAKASKIGIDP